MLREPDKLATLIIAMLVILKLAALRPGCRIPVLPCIRELRQK
jgi:hypothetical protein